MVCDPACGTGGFLLAAYAHIRRHHKPSGLQIKHLHTNALRGVQLVDSVARLCCMNMVLHGIGGDASAPVPVEVKDALAAKGDEFDVVLSNPPFGKKSSVTIVNQAGESARETLTIHRPRDSFLHSTPLPCPSTPRT